MMQRAITCHFNNNNTFHPNCQSHFSFTFIYLNTFRDIRAYFCVESTISARVKPLLVYSSHLLMDKKWLIGQNVLNHERILKAERSLLKLIREKTIFTYLDKELKNDF